MVLISLRDTDLWDRPSPHVDSSAEAVFMPDFDIGCQRGKCFGGAWRVAAEVVVQNDASVVQI